MPGGDRSGPLGMGPRTGRAAGFCAGFRTPGYANPEPAQGLGRGYGQGRGFGGGGRGWRNQFYATGLPGWARGGRFLQPESSPSSADAGSSQDEEIGTLASRTKALESDLSALKKRLAELEGSSGA